MASVDPRLGERMSIPRIIERVEWAIRCKREHPSYSYDKRVALDIADVEALVESARG